MSTVACVRSAQSFVNAKARKIHGSACACEEVCWCAQAYERLRRALLPVLHQLESVDEGSNEPQLRDWSSLQMLARRTKNQLVLE